MSSVRRAIQQYGGIAETLVHAFLSFAPVAANTEDIDTERTFQLIQSVSDAVALRHDKFLTDNSNNYDLWAEMKSVDSYQFAMKIELLRLGLSSILFRSDGAGRLPDLEIFEMESTPTDPIYVGSRTGTRLPSLSKFMKSDNQSETQFSDFLHAIVPIVYLASSPRKGWNKATWMSWFLAAALEYASILALPESRGMEKRIRLKKLVFDSIIKQPMFNVILDKPASAISNVWNNIPLVRDLNYLEYYLHMHKKYFYFHQ